MIDTSLILCTPLTGVKDEYGNPATGFEEREILAQQGEVYRSEFYEASRAGFKPEITFSVARIDYKGEKVVKYGNSYYVVIRTTGNPDSDYLTLICESRVNEKDY